MALVKDYQTEYGVTANYWKLTEFFLNKVLKTATVIFGLYTSAEFKAVYYKHVFVPTEKYDEFFLLVNSLGITAGAEEYVMNNEELFADAVPYTGAVKEDPSATTLEEADVPEVSEEE